MKVADFWLEAAQMADMWAGLGRAHSKRLSPLDRQITEETARHLSLLADSYRQLALQETREIDPDDAPTPATPEYQIELLEDLGDDPTDPGPTWGESVGTKRR